MAAAVDGHLVDLSTRARRRGRGRRRDRRLPEAGREVLRHSTAHVLAQAVLPAVAGRPLRHRPGDRGRLLLRLRAARRGALQRRGPRPDRGRRCAQIMAEDQPFVATSTPSTRAWPCSATSPSSARSSRRSGAAPTRWTLDRPRGSRAQGGRLDLLELRRRSPTCAGAPTCPSTVAAGPLQADAGGRRLLAGRREAAPAPAHLRHRLGVREGPRRAPPPPGGGRAPRPPQARGRARPVLVPRPRSDRAWPSSTPRVASSAA